MDILEIENSFEKIQMELKQIKKEVKEVHQENQDLKSRIIKLKNILSVDEKLKDEDFITKKEHQEIVNHIKKTWAKL